MSPAERLFWQRVQRRAATLSPELRAAVLRGFAALREGLTTAEVIRLISDGAPERVTSALFGEAEIHQAFVQLRREIRGGVEAAGVNFSRDLPAAARLAEFDVLNPKVVDGIRQLQTRVVATLGEQVRETVRAYVENGLRDGVSPTTIARGLRDVIGLAPNQEQWVRNYRLELEGKLPTDTLTRRLRDRRFDATVQRGSLTTEQIDRATDAYRRRMLAFNADTNTRTMALDAQKLGQRLTWDAAVERGDIDGGRLMKRWGGVMDARERDEHVAMEGEVVGYDESFSNGEQVPGESTFNCRCIAFFFTARDPLTARRQGAGAAGLSVEDVIGGAARARAAA